MHKTPQVTYVASANQVVIPEYLLQPPVFHPANPVSVVNLIVAIIIIWSTWTVLPSPSSLLPSSSSWWPRSGELEPWRAWCDGCSRRPRRSCWARRCLHRCWQTPWLTNFLNTKVYFCQKICDFVDFQQGINQYFHHMRKGHEIFQNFYTTASFGFHKFHLWWGKLPVVIASVGSRLGQIETFSSQVVLGR